MRVIRHLARQAARLPRVVLTLGNFDGAHQGHRSILRRAADVARGLDGQVVVLTFHPHPVAVVAPERAPAMLQTLHDRLSTLRGQGADVVVLQRFTRAFSLLEPEEFVRDFLLRSLDLQHVVVGYDLSFGRNRTGTVETLRDIGGRADFSVDVVGAVETRDGQVVSSSGVRKALSAGDVDLVTRLLGRRHALRGRVVRGDQRGRTLGFPTANLHVGERRLLLPPDGVYAVWAAIDGRAVPAVMNIGLRPTFGSVRRTIEVHCLDFAGDLYGRWLRVEMVARLRGEERFSGVDALMVQIGADCAAARTALASSPPSDP